MPDANSGKCSPCHFGLRKARRGLLEYYWFLGILTARNMWERPHPPTAARRGGGAGPLSVAEGLGPDAPWIDYQSGVAPTGKGGRIPWAWAQTYECEGGPHYERHSAWPGLVSGRGLGLNRRSFMAGRAKRLSAAQFALSAGEPCSNVKRRQQAVMGSWRGGKLRRRAHTKQAHGKRRGERAPCPLKKDVT